ncbi:hypothetical protein ACFWUU_12320 [Kribbella sp. NPDC058693]|uniref:DUF7144 domain-containing protein n=1 Tax=Kribbella jiaozuonensis TaxID=2575441 RepID=A0A4U3LM39_9ACTN|nr:hypothetical protein [Kribbella jiaozuonensis]TKK76209.1 hypothetical protein FDA38_27750 [Kribbella jiaozuonensis]
MAAKKVGAAMTGVVVFAGAVLMVIGLVNVFEGLVALFSDERLVVTPSKLVLVDVTGWGWILLIFGLLLMPVGAGLIAARTWARITAILLVSLHAVVQILWLGAYPVWSVLMIVLDVVVLYALTARWSDVRDQLGGIDEAPWTRDEEAQLTTADRRRPPH